MEKYFFDLNYIPEWARKSYKDALTTYSNITKNIVKLARAISVMENHATAGTVPKSLNVNIKAQVEKSHQAQVDLEVEEAKKVFQKTILASIIAARRREIEDKKKARDEALTQFQETFLTNLTDLKSNGIIATPEDELRKMFDNIVKYLHQTAELIEEDLRTEEFFAFKQKEESMRKADAARQEVRLNQVLEDPGTKALKDRLDTLEKRIQHIGKQEKPGPKKPAPGPKAPQRNPKGKGPSQKKGDGPKKGPGKGNKKVQPSSTPTMTRSASKKAVSRKKHN